MFIQAQYQILYGISQNFAVIQPADSLWDFLLNKNLNTSKVIDGGASIQLFKA